MMQFSRNASYRPSCRTVRGRAWSIIVLLFCLAMTGTLSAEISTVRIPDGGSFWRPPFGFRPTPPHPAVVRIAVAERATTANGSGALVGLYDRYGLVVTNWHVVQDAAGDIAVIFPDGFRSASRVLDVDEEWDLAALLIWRPHVQPIPIANVAPRPGDTLSIAGYGQGSYRAATGQCTQYVAPGANRPYEMVEVSVPARQGDSGGPIFNERGELAGVLFGSANGTTSGSYCGRVQRFLDNVWPPDTSPGATDIASPETQPNSTWNARPGSHVSGGPFDVEPTRSPGNHHSAANIATIGYDIDLSPPTDPNEWSRWTGQTPFEQSKTFLAGIGLLTVLVQFSKFFFGGEKKGE